MSLKAVLFDLDNTILDRKKTFLSYCMFFFEKYSIVNDDTSADLTKWIKILIDMDNEGEMDKTAFFSDLLISFPWKQKTSIDELLTEYRMMFAQLAKPMEGALEALLWFKMHFKTALVTNGETKIQMEKINRLSISHLFDTIVISEQVGYQKPDPRIFNLTLRRLNVSYKEAAYLGDHPLQDMLGAMNVGMRGIWLLTNKTWEKHEFNFKRVDRINQWNELMPLIKGFVNEY